MLLKQCAKIAVIKTKILVKKMKFTIERANLLKSLSHVQSIVEKRNTIPVLSNVRIEAMEDGISFKATDMDTEITEIVDAKTIETGATTAPAHMLYDIVRKLSDGSDVELTFPDDKGQLTIASGKSKFSLSCIGVEDFPVISGDKLLPLKQNKSTTLLVKSTMSFIKGYCAFIFLLYLYKQKFF